MSRDIFEVVKRWFTRSPEEPLAATARLFKRFRQPGNHNYFDGLVRWLAPLYRDPSERERLKLYFEFAITANDRGRRVANILRRHVDLRERAFLDIGCAYGGFVVAFADHGAQVMGLDIDPHLLDLARLNLLDAGLDAPLLRCDATRSDDVQHLAQSFDVITCNDVIEHVPEPAGLLANVARMLRPGGLAYFEIPNGRCIDFVLRDGHYLLFAITLLDYPLAKEYHGAVFPQAGSYDVYSYLTLEGYRALFRRAGLKIAVLDETFDGLAYEPLRKRLGELRQAVPRRLADVPESLRPPVSQCLESYLAEATAATEDGSKFLLEYGASFWRVLATHSESSTAP